MKKTTLSHKQTAANEKMIIDLQRELLAPGVHAMQIGADQERDLLYQTLNYIAVYRPAAYLSLYSHMHLHAVTNIYHPRATPTALLKASDDFDLIFIDLWHATPHFIESVNKIHEHLMGDQEVRSALIIERVH